MKSYLPFIQFYSVTHVGSEPTTVNNLEVSVGFVLTFDFFLPFSILKDNSSLFQHVLELSPIYSIIRRHSHSLITDNSKQVSEGFVPIFGFFFFCPFSTLKDNSFIPTCLPFIQLNSVIHITSTLTTENNLR